MTGRRRKVELAALAALTALLVVVLILALSQVPLGPE